MKTCCLPVVSARLNPDVGLHYNDKDLQHALSESHWYVSGYSLGFENPATYEFEDLFTDVDQVSASLSIRTIRCSLHQLKELDSHRVILLQASTMFRIVVKSNLSQGLAENLAQKIKETLTVLDDLDEGYEGVKQKLTALKAKAAVLSQIRNMHKPTDKRFKALAKTVLFSKHIERKEKERSNISGSIVSQAVC